MKYIKTFENKTYACKCWELFPRDPYLRISLKNIGIKPDRIDYWYNVISELRPESIYLYHDYYLSGSDTWLWNENFVSEYNNLAIIFMGVAKATPDQIKEYELMKNANKYNL